MKLQTTPLESIDFLTKEYASLRKQLSDRVTALNDEIAAAQRRKLPGIKLALGAAKAAQNCLSEAIRANPELFEKPRTFTVHGIKIGLKKGVGTIEWDDDDRVVALIKKRFAQEMIDTLIIVKETPSKDALNQLPVEELRRLGVTVEEVGDCVVIKPEDGDVDKLVKRILKEGSKVAEVAE